MAIIQDNKPNATSWRPTKMNENFVSSKGSLALAKFPANQLPSNVAMKSQSHKRKRLTHDTLYDNDEVQSAVMMQAKEVQANLAPEFPSFIKLMRRSHVSSCFWLGLPMQFCIEHMPKQDTIMVLVDESGKNYETKYLVDKVGLSGGWRGFSMVHHLQEGDVLVFHLVRPKMFKVYIARENGSDEASGALGLLNLDACKWQMDIENPLNITTEELGDQCIDLIEYSEEIQQNSANACNAMPISVQSGIESQDLGFEVSNGIKLSESAIGFKEVKSIEDFSIVVNGLVVKSELSKYLLSKYYQLCCSQDSFLHDKLLEDLNCELIAGVIAETVNIADAIKASKISTSLHDFAIWEMTLKSFDTLGMNVSFLLDRLAQLVRLTTKSKQYEEVILEREFVVERKKLRGPKLSGVKPTINGLDGKIETMEMDDDNLELLFQKVAKAPW